MTMLGAPMSKDAMWTTCQTMGGKDVQIVLHMQNEADTRTIKGRLSIEGNDIICTHALGSISIYDATITAVYSITVIEKQQRAGSAKKRRAESSSRAASVEPNKVEEINMTAQLAGNTAETARRETQKLRQDTEKLRDAAQEAIVREGEERASQTNHLKGELEAVKEQNRSLASQMSTLAEVVSSLRDTLTTHGVPHTAGPGVQDASSIPPSSMLTDHQQWPNMTARYPAVSVLAALERDYGHKLQQQSPHTRAEYELTRDRLLGLATHISRGVRENVPQWIMESWTDVVLSDLTRLEALLYGAEKGRGHVELFTAATKNDQKDERMRRLRQEADKLSAKMKKEDEQPPRTHHRHTYDAPAAGKGAKGYAMQHKGHKGFRPGKGYRYHA